MELESGSSRVDCGQSRGQRRVSDDGSDLTGDVRTRECRGAVRDQRVDAHRS